MMRKLIKLSLLTLFFSFILACSTKVTSVTTYIGKGSSGISACAGAESIYWNDCYGVVRHYTNGVPIWESESAYKSGKQEGKITTRYFLDGEIIYCESTNYNGKTEGWVICRTSNKIISREYFKNGIKSPEEAKIVELEEQKKECLHLGFKDKTPEMGNCILKLREIKAVKYENSNSSNQLSIKKEPSDLEKLNALNQLLQGVQQSTGNRISNMPSRGVVCTQVSEQRNGVYKTCFYNCAGTSTTTTIRSAETCPVNTNF